MVQITSEPIRKPGIQVADSDCPTRFYLCGKCYFWEYGACKIKEDQKKQVHTAVTHCRA